MINKKIFITIMLSTIFSQSYADYYAVIKSGDQYFKTELDLADEDLLKYTEGWYAFLEANCTTNDGNANVSTLPTLSDWENYGSITCNIGSNPFPDSNSLTKINGDADFSSDLDNGFFYKTFYGIKNVEGSINIHSSGENLKLENLNILERFYLSNSSFNNLDIDNATIGEMLYVYSNNANTIDLNKIYTDTIYIDLDDLNNFNVYNSELNDFYSNITDVGKVNFKYNKFLEDDNFALNLENANQVYILNNDIKSNYIYVKNFKLMDVSNNAISEQLSITSENSINVNVNNNNMESAYLYLGSVDTINVLENVNTDRSGFVINTNTIKNINLQDNSFYSSSISSDSIENMEILGNNFTSDRLGISSDKLKNLNIKNNDFHSSYVYTFDSDNLIYSNNNITAETNDGVAFDLSEIKNFKMDSNNLNNQKLYIVTTKSNNISVINSKDIGELSISIQSSNLLLDNINASDSKKIHVSSNTDSLKGTNISISNSNLLNLNNIRNISEEPIIYELPPGFIPPEGFEFPETTSISSDLDNLSLNNVLLNKDLSINGFDYVNTISINDLSAENSRFTLTIEKVENLNINITKGDYLFDLIIGESITNISINNTNINDKIRLITNISQLDNLNSFLNSDNLIIKYTDSDGNTSPITSLISNSSVFCTNYNVSTFVEDQNGSLISKNLICN